MKWWLACALGGALGAVGRYGLSGWIGQRFGVFPWGTAAVNVAGCFAIGIGWFLAERWALPPVWRTGFFVGFLGAFTTFSTYALETVHMLRDGETVMAATNLMLHNFGGVLAVMLGYWTARVFFP